MCHVLCYELLLCCSCHAAVVSSPALHTISQSCVQSASIPAADDACRYLACLRSAVLCAELGLVPSKEGYHAIKLEGCEFLLATTADGKLDLSDVYVQVSGLLCLLLACIL